MQFSLYLIKVLKEAHVDVLVLLPFTEHQDDIYEKELNVILESYIRP
jgi:hypothetical protein